jgi:5-methylcytosine-specific restriction protein A
MPRAKQICSTSECLEIAVSDGKCDDHKRKPWSNTSRRNISLPSDWKTRRARVLRRDRRTCYLCGERNAHEVDHVTPVSRGGSHEYDNLKAICSACHSIKSLAERQPRS